MGQQFLIDSNIVIDYLDGKLPLTGMSFMNDVINAIPNISIITKIEVLGYKPPEHTYTLLTEFANAAIVFDLNEEIVTATIALRKIRKIKTPDAIIAATAIVFNLTLLTRNVTDFQNIKGLLVLNPYEVK
ncbi:MAG: type toxin-antitoxin system VapC family toxin [Flavipsychrobacter sp.]|jgi:predicted nucleic acid-binding protein|nr:type toxin-antitoxin system VapC family toxin [Flavipsychrobacter sp.]